jgi:hypothetical protein
VESSTLFSRHNRPWILTALLLLQMFLWFIGIFASLQELTRPHNLAETQEWVGKLFLCILMLFVLVGVWRQEWWGHLAFFTYSAIAIGDTISRFMAGERNISDLVNAATVVLMQIVLFAGFAKTQIARRSNRPQVGSSITAKRFPALSLETWIGLWFGLILNVVGYLLTLFADDIKRFLHLQK